MSLNRQTSTLTANDANTLVPNRPPAMPQTTNSQVHVTVHVNNCLFPRYRIPRSVLVEESGFFRRMFANSYQETLNNEVTLHDDDATAIHLLLSVLQNHQSMQSDTIAMACPEQLGNMARIRNLKATECIKIVIELYIVADKYDMPTIQKQSAWTMMCGWVQKLVLEIDLGETTQYDSYQHAVKEVFFNVVCDRLGDYPQDLYLFFQFCVMLALVKHKNADILLSAARAYPDLLMFVASKLGAGYCNDQEELAAAKKEISALERRARRIKDAVAAPDEQSDEET